jgi:Repeat of unknown function (DUF5907)
MRQRTVIAWVLACLLPALAWGQQAQMINGNRVHAGWVNAALTTGTGTTYALSFTPAMPAYLKFTCFLFQAHVANTGPATLNVSGLGAIQLTKLSGSSLVALAAGDMPVNRLLQACYDGTNFQLMGAAGTTGTGVTDGDKQDITVSSGGTIWTIDTGAVTYAKIQPMTSSRLLGRTTAGTGSVEELTAAQVKTMLGVTFGDLTGAATDAQIPDLNTLSTGLLASRCVETDGTGKLGVAAGTCGTGGAGTGISGATNHGLMVATGGTTASSLGVAANGQLPIGSSAADPVLGTLTGTANQIAVTNGPGTITLSIPTNPTLPGTTTGSFSGPLAGNASTATALQADLPYSALTPATAASRLLGRGSAAGAGDWQEVTLGTNLSMSGTTLNATTGGITDGDKTDITVSGGGTVWTIDNTAVTYAKIQNVSATSRLLGRATAGAGPIEELTAAQVKTLLGMTFGDLTGTATDAQIPDLATLSTGLTASRCVQTTAGGLLGVAAGACGTGSGGPTIQNEGIAVANQPQPNLNFTGAGIDCTPDVANSRITCAVSSTGSSPGIFGTPTAGQVAIWHDATSIEGVSTLTIAYAAAHVTASGTVTTGVEYVATSTGTVTRTLPAAASGTTTRRFRVIKEDSAVGTLTVAPLGADTINGSTAALSTGVQWGGFQLDEVSATGWVSTPILPGAGQGDFSTNTSTSLPDELVLFSNTTGKQGKRATTNGVLAATSGALRQAIGGSDIVTPTGAEDVSNKRIVKRVAQLSAATGTVTAPDANVTGAEIYYRYDISGTLTIPVPSGTPLHGQQLLFRLKPQTAQQTITFTGGAGGFCAIAGLALPTTTGDNATYVEYGFTYASNVSPNACWVFDATTKGTAPLSLADGGTGVALTDPNANRALVWDDTTNAMRLAVLGPGLTYNSGTNTLSPGGIRYISLECIPDATAWSVANGKCYAPISPDWNGWSVTNVTGYLGGAVSSSGLPTVGVDICAAVATGIRCSGTNRALFSTALTFDVNESRSTLAATQPVINTAANNAVVASGEHLRVNVTAAGTSTAGLYLIITLTAP